MITPYLYVPGRDAGYARPYAPIIKEQGNQYLTISSQTFRKDFQLKIVYNTSAMPLKYLLLIILLFCLFNVHAQEKTNFVLQIETGFLAFSNSENLGIFLNVEPKLKSSENTVIGLRFGATVNSQTIENNDIFQFKIDEESDNGAISFVPTFDYYFNENYWRPNLGFGVGYYLLASYIDVSRKIIADPSEDVVEGRVDNQVGFLVRGGFELGNLRLGLEYNFVPKADIEIPNGQIIGTVKNSYWGLSIGFTIGAGKSAK